MKLDWPDVGEAWERAVAAYLRANPAWLADHPELYGALAPPARVHGEAIADHMAAMLRQARGHAARMTEQAEAVLAANRLGATLLARVQEAVVALIGCGDVGECLSGEVARVLAVDAVCLCRLGGEAAADREAARLLGLLGPRDVVFRREPVDAGRLYAEAAPLAVCDVLIRVPGVGVLALGARGELDSARCHATAAFRFLGQAVAARVAGGSGG